MFKIKIKYKQKRKKAQHIVEFAILMPIFIAIFCYMFPILTLTYRNFKFSYFASSLVTKALENPRPAFYNNRNDWNANRFNDQIEEALPNIGEQATVFYTMETPQTDFVSLGFRAPMRTLLGIIGNNYFYFMIPVNSAYVEAPVFNIPTRDLDSKFEEYYRRQPQIRSSRKNTMNNEKNVIEEHDDEGMDGALGG